MLVSFCVDNFVNLNTFNLSIGYDVWMGNTRGNTYSRNHVSLESCSTCKEFWDFGFDDTGAKDYPAEIDYILEQTGQEKLHFVGHSMGATQYIVQYIRQLIS